MDNNKTALLKTVLFAAAVFTSTQAFSQRGGPAPVVPEVETVAAIPSIRPVTGSGPAWDSSPAQWPGHGITDYDYEINEYLISGTAAGEPYTTRLVIRKPSDDSRFSGLIVAEPMHPIGGAHAFEYNSVYIMDSGHINVEISTNGAMNFRDYNPERYGDIQITPAQTTEVLAQAGALIKSDRSPIANLDIRNMVMWGTSASSGILVSYLDGHKVFTLANGDNIYDGFMPTSNGSDIEPVDVPMIQVPTQHEYGSVATAHQDSDEPGSQFRVYEFAGLAHLDARNNGARFTQQDCRNPMSQFPQEAYFSVALHHLLQWVDRGIEPPSAPRVLMDMYEGNDGSLMMLDEFGGNAIRGIRNPYVDVPAYKYTMRNVGSAPMPARGGPGGGGAFPAAQLCNLSGWQTAIAAEDMRERYGSTANYVRMFEERLNELESEGWSLPVYHDLIMEDARQVRF